VNVKKSPRGNADSTNWKGHSHDQAACISTVMQRTFVSLPVYYYSGQSTLHTPVTTYRVSMSFSGKGILKENLSQHHIIIFMTAAREIFCYAVEVVMTRSVQLSNFWANSQQSCP